MHPKTSRDNTRHGRLKAIGAGLVLVAVGVLRLRVGIQVVTHSIGQPVFSWGLIAAGIVCIVFAFIPSAWIASALGARQDRGRPNERGR